MYYRQDELTHYGILGQRWGIRRYQNYDGTYTQAGLERYNKAKSKYESTKSDYKSGNATKSQVKTAKKAMDSAYEKLKTDKMADQGKELYKSGKTITTNNSKLSVKKLVINEAVVLLGSNAVSGALAASGFLTLSLFSGQAIAVAGTVANVGTAVKTENENKKLRAYYAH